jgi:lipopolysaccharide export system permease protein
MSVKSKTRGVDALPTSQLIGVNDSKHQAELQWRIAIPVSILLITFMAVPMAKVNPRQGRYSKLLPALALYLAFFLLLSASKSLIEDGVLPYFAMWGVQILFFVIGVVLHLQTIGKFNFKVKKTKVLKVEK